MTGMLALASALAVHWLPARFARGCTLLKSTAGAGNVRPCFPMLSAWTAGNAMRAIHPSSIFLLLHLITSCHHSCPQNKKPYVWVQKPTGEMSSHNDALAATLYNKVFHVLVTVDEGGSVCTWNMQVRAQRVDEVGFGLPGWCWLQ